MKSQTKKKNRLLQALCSYRCLTTRQCVAAGFGSEQVVRRYIREFKQAKLVSCSPWQFGQDTGRPENLAIPTQSGLQAVGLTGAPIKQRAFAHQHHLNWCQIRFEQLKSAQLGLSYTVVDILNLATLNKGVIPDMAFALTSKTHNKRLLFFVEMDMGTETLVSASGRSGDLCEKIEAYRELRLSGAYTKAIRGQRVSEGFRLLLVLAHKPRLLQTLRLCQQMRPCPFVWCVDFETLSRLGAGEAIWHKEGDASHTYSILGSLKDDYLALSQKQVSASQSP